MTLVHVKSAWRNPLGLPETHLSPRTPTGPVGPVRSARRRRAFTLIELVAVVIVISALVGLALPRLRDAVDRARIAKAIGDIKALQIELESLDSLPPSLAAINRDGYRDPWGSAYIYYMFPDAKSKGPPQGARRDRFLVPVNSEYDLYSMGADGQTAIAFTAKNSHDDVVRASDGGYVGLARKY